MSVIFKDYSKIVIDRINNESVAWLEEASALIESQTKRNTKVKTGRTKGSWEHVVNGYKLEAQVGSRYKNALWEELGTGIFALRGNGRKTKWVYKAQDGKFYTTLGKKPRRMLWNAYTSLREKIIRSAQQRFKKL